MDLNPNTLTEPIIKQLVDQHNIRVDQENYEGGQKIKLHTDHSVKKILYRKLDEYVMPAMNIAQYKSYSAAVVSALRKQFNIKKEHYKRMNLPFYDTLDEDLKHFKDPTINMDGTHYGYNYFMKDYDYNTPLVCPEEKIEWETVYEYSIKTYADGKTLNLPETLIMLLDTAQAKGLSMRMLNKVLYKLVLKHLPELKGVADRYMVEKHPRKLFGVIVESIDIPRQKEKVRAARENVCRTVGEEINVSVDKLRNLAIQELNLNQPDLNEHELNDAVELLVIAGLRDFITEPTLKKVTAIQTERVKLGAEKSNLLQTLRDVKDVENLGPEWRPKHTMYAKKSINDMELATLVKKHDPTEAQVNFASTNFRKRDRSSGRDSRYNNQRDRYRRQSGGRNYSRDRRDSRDRGNRSNQNREDRYNRDDKHKGDRQKRYGSRNRDQRERGDRSNSRNRYERGNSRDRYRSRDRNEKRSYQRNRSGSSYRSASRDRNSYSRRGSFSRDRGSSSRDSRSYSRSESRGRRGQSQSPYRRRDGRNGSYSRKPSYDKYRNSNNNYNRKRSPKSYQSACVKCDSESHNSKECHRYPGWVDKACDICLKKGRNLFHEPSHCRFARSKYVSPAKTSNSLN